MKSIQVVRIATQQIEAQQVPALLDGARVLFQPIDVVNWAEYPYQPKVQFRVAHNDTAILLHYKVEEQSVRGRAAVDNGPVWMDSCVEFFVASEAEGDYYNVESNCVGTVLLGAGRQGARRHAPQHAMQGISRWASLGRTPIVQERKENTSWELALVLPLSEFLLPGVESLSGHTLRGNFYKCGDELEVPHFLSWNPIPTVSPDFHQPHFFGELRFE